MVMWNLVGHGVKWAARGIDAFSRTEAGKKTAEISVRSFHAAREASREMIDSYKASKQADPSYGKSSSSAKKKWNPNATVVTHDGRLGTVVRYLQANEIGGSQVDVTVTDLVLLDLAQSTSELDRYLIIHESSLKGI